MTRRELYNLRHDKIQNHKYVMSYYKDFDYSILKNIMYEKRAGSKNHDSFNDCIIMADTETSKKAAGECENHVVAFSVSIRALDVNICTLYGNKPSECVECIEWIHEAMQGDKTIIYFHNFAYDYVFLRLFMFKLWGTPEKVLNTKSHYPINMEFSNGLIFKDSYILSQRSLDKWAKDMQVEHQKALGKWDYDMLRHQNHTFTHDELEYIEHDTLAGVECIQKLKDQLRKHMYAMPYTATGIPREEVRERANNNRGHDSFLRQALTYEQYNTILKVYHGGYTHANRHYIDVHIKELVQCRDFSSSYPYCLLSEKFPSEKFTPFKDCTIDDILGLKDKYAFMLKLTVVKPRLKNDFEPMPSMQVSKCYSYMDVVDNGRILTALYVETYMSEQDLDIFNSIYDYDYATCTEVEISKKEYLPRWFTDYVYQLYSDKCTLKGKDPILYALQKAKLNSLYGMCVQKSLRDNIVEDYETGEYNVETQTDEESYHKYLDNRNSVLPYQWGVWVTAYGMHNLFDLGRCCEEWIYSDTDSCYGINWDNDKLTAYNDKCKNKLRNNGYDAVVVGNKEYWLGVAEADGEYSEYIVQGAKRYCGRSIEDGELHITVAGVPKKGAECLNDDINNFTSGMNFSGSITGKKTYTYHYVDDIYIDENGNETGDSIDLNPCDYLLDSVYVPDWESIFKEEIQIQNYEQDT